MQTFHTDVEYWPPFSSVGGGCHCRILTPFFSLRHGCRILRSQSPAEPTRPWWTRVPPGYNTCFIRAVFQLSGLGPARPRWDTRVWWWNVFQLCVCLQRVGDGQGGDTRTTVYISIMPTKWKYLLKSRVRQSRLAWLHKRQGGVGQKLVTRMINRPESVRSNLSWLFCGLIENFADFFHVYTSMKSLSSHVLFNILPKKLSNTIIFRKRMILFFLSRTFSSFLIIAQQCFPYHTHQRNRNRSYCMDQTLAWAKWTVLVSFESKETKNVHSNLIVVKSIREVSSCFLNVVEVCWWKKVGKHHQQCQMWFWKMLKNMFSSCPPASCSTMTTSVGSGLEQLACSIVPPLSYHNHKGQAGRIGIVGGSPEWVHIFLGVPSHGGYFNIQSDIFRDHSRYAPSQWEITLTLHCNGVSHWLAMAARIPLIPASYRKISDLWDWALKCSLYLAGVSAAVLQKCLPNFNVIRKLNTNLI